MPGVTIQKLTSTDAFIAYDFADAPSMGVTRSAPKILVDGANLLARSLTYRFASFNRKVGGASAGVNATPEGRGAALAAFVAEVEPLVRSGQFATDAAKGVDPSELAALRAADVRPESYWELHTELTSLGIAIAADLATGGLEGRTVAIEGLDDVGAAIAAAVIQRGARVVAVATSAGSIADPSGFDAERLLTAWSDKGVGLVEDLGAEVAKPWTIFGHDVDVLVVGSKPGVIDHTVASGVKANVIVPSAAVPVTAKALAVLRRAEVVVIPDFVSTSGSMFAGWPTETTTDPRLELTSSIEAVLDEVLVHDDGPLLGACYRAEAFMSTWRDELPFGRPLA